MVIEPQDIDVNYGDIGNLKDFIYYNNEANSQPTLSNLWDALRPVVCTIPFRSFDEDGYPASYLSVIPPPSTDSKIKDIMDTMELWWTSSRSKTCDDLANPCPYNVDEDHCQYSALDFGDIVKYFESEKEMNAYMNTDEYASSSWDPTDPESDGVRPVSFAIVFDEYDEWHSMAYTLRGNASFFPPTDGPQINTFEKAFFDLYFAGFGVKSLVYQPFQFLS